MDAQTPQATLDVAVAEVRADEVRFVAMEEESAAGLARTEPEGWEEVFPFPSRSFRYFA